jgi:hypothetical protein
VAQGACKTGVFSPSVRSTAGILKGLKPSPPIGTDGFDVTHAVYQSTIPNASPDEVYDHMVNDPCEVFGAGGMEIRSSSQKLEDGGRYMLEIGGPVPTGCRLKSSSTTRPKPSPSTRSMGPCCAGG